MLEAVGISVTLGGKRVLRDASLAVAGGEVVALIGPNGAGKSTLLSCLTGALVPDRGEVQLDGRKPASLTPAELALQRAVLEQAPVSSAPFLVEELIGLALPRRIPVDEVNSLTHRAAAGLGLTELLRQPATRLSGGEHHRVHMARALAQLWAGRRLGGGRWLLLDEPTASLDLGHQDAVLRAARAAAMDGAGVLAILHDLTLAAAVADRIVLMHQGAVVADGPVREVLTAERLTEVYGLDVTISEPAAGVLTVTPLFTQAKQGATECLSR
ncbi:heme ABC transporter ATP-binding protein [Rhodobacteraceae bacterium NNCM2]|nr:heme ABC transporter ATP-binding protein [Coraliihabitans acroporae]